MTMREVSIDPILSQQAHADAGARRLSGAALAEALRDSRHATWAFVADLDDTQWQVPQQRGVNPVAWELAHVAWFAEFWIERGPHRVGPDGLVLAAGQPLRCGPDDLFDSARLPHAQRWQASLPTRGELVQRLDAQLDAALRALPQAGDDRALYFHRLALYHEDMHAEAFAWMRAALAYPPPAGFALPTLPELAPVAVAGGPIRCGRPADATGFWFDNEMPGHTAAVADFEIDGRCVTQGEFLSFVEDGGYDEDALWAGAAGRWRAGTGLRHPVRWRRGSDGWQQRWFDRWIPIEPAAPVVHVSAYEAEAWSAWAGRRLPRAAEWELAATTLPSDRFAWGASVWEWTADPFEPYPGFVDGPYRDYSMPWFGDHRELRGGSFATHRRLHDARFRNFFQTDRCDVFAGFRTAR